MNPGGRGGGDEQVSPPSPLPYFDENSSKFSQVIWTKFGLKEWCVTFFVDED